MKAKGGFTFGIYRDFIRDITLQYRKQTGKYYVMLTLDEAEHFRGVLHARMHTSLLTSEGNLPNPLTTSALWLMGDNDVVLLAQSKGFQHNGAHAAQHSAMVNSYRFVNSESYYTDNGIAVLLRILENSTCEDREKWWTDVRACRRRRQIAVDASVAISSVFTTVSEIEFIEFKSVVERIKFGLAEKGLLVFDAFRAFNSSNTALLTCSELYGGMDFLDIPFTAEQIYYLVRKLAIQNEGLVSYPDFKRIFQGKDDEIESRAVVGEGASNFETIVPRNIPELVDLNRHDDHVVINITDDILANFKAKTKPLTSFVQVWDSRGTQSESQVSIWCPSLNQGMLSANKLKICLGHYATKGLYSPAKNKRSELYQTIEITDNATIRMKRSRIINAVADAILPYPVRYKQLWHLSRNGKTMYAWKPIAPEGYIALGMLCTMQDNEPGLKDMRCVPQSWTTVSKIVPKKIWDDTGAGGGKPGSMWTVNSMDMIVVVPGHEPPKEEFYDLNASKFDLLGLKNLKMGSKK